MPPASKNTLVNSFLLKVTNRCNFGCDHCYFREHADRSCLTRPADMDAAVVRLFAERLGEYARYSGIEHVEILFHGGEPLIRGIAFFDEAVDRISKALPGTCTPHFCVQSNASLVSSEWIDCFYRNRIRLSASLDGPKSAQDLHRRFGNGDSTFDTVVRNIKTLQAHRHGKDVFGGILAVADLRTDPSEVFEFHRGLGIPGIDYLWPDGNHDQPPPGMAAYRTHDAYARWSGKVFDTWFAEGTGTPPIRLFENILTLLLGGDSDCEGIGPNSLNLLTIQTDGEIQDTDVLTVAYEHAARFGNGVYLSSTYLPVLIESPAFRRQAHLYERSQLNALCRSCELVDICSGGLLPHRYSRRHGYDAPSVYCGNLFHLIRHIRASLLNELRHDQGPDSYVGEDIPSVQGSHINYMEHLDAFIASWDAAPVKRPPDSVSLQPSPDHRNIDGDIMNTTAEILSPHEPGFLAAVEAGVRRLVELLVYRLGLITYSSCQGHSLPDGKRRDRHVGVLPRDKDEERWAFDVLATIASLANRVSYSPIQAEVRPDVLTDASQTAATIDLLFVAPQLPNEVYCAYVAQTYDAFTDLLDYWTGVTPPNDLREPCPRGTILAWQSERSINSRGSAEPCIDMALPQQSCGHNVTEDIERALCNLVHVSIAEDSDTVRVRADRPRYGDEYRLVTRQMLHSRVVVVQNHAWALLAWLGLMAARPLASRPEATLIMHYDSHTDMMSPLLAAHSGTGVVLDCLTGCAVDFNDLCSVANAIRSTAIGPGSFMLPFLHVAQETSIVHETPPWYRDADGVSVPQCCHVVADGRLPMGLSGCGFRLSPAADGSIRWLRAGYGCKASASGKWILDIDCDYFDNERNGDSDWRSRGGRQRRYDNVMGEVDRVVRSVAACDRLPDLVTIAMSPDFCPPQTAEVIVARVMDGLDDVARLHGDAKWPQRID